MPSCPARFSCCPVGCLFVSSISVDLLPLVALLPGRPGQPDSRYSMWLCVWVLGLSRCANVPQKCCCKLCVPKNSHNLLHVVASYLQLFLSSLLLLLLLLIRKLLPAFEFPAQRSAPMPCVSPRVRNHGQILKNSI